MANSSPSPLLSSSCSPSSCTSFLENEEDFIHFKATPQQHVLPYGRAVNFSAGPACLPVEVLLQAQHDLLNWHGCGMSIMEMSHRGRFYLKMMEDTENRLTSLLEIPQTHRLLFMQGGATMQFAAQPLNMLRSLGDTADYVITGNWSEYAWKEGKKYGPMRIASDNRTGSFKSVDIPSVQEWQLNPHAAYVHYCDNETVYGLEFAEPPDLSLAQILSPEELQTLKLSQHNPAQLQATSKAASPAGLLQACADGTKKGEEKDRKEEEMKKNPISDQEKDIENYLPASSHTNGLNGRDRHSSGVPTSFFSTCPSLEESTKGVYSSTNRSAYVWNLTSDMSSNFCSRPIDFEKYALIYAGAQKNVGPSGVTMVIGRRDVLQNQELDICPSMCSYRLCEKAKSALNTPPVFSIYMVGLMSKYLLQQGGLKTWNEKCIEKSRLLYEAIDSSDGFYHCPVQVHSRSRMNVRFLVIGAKREEDEEEAKETQETSEGVSSASEKGHASVVDGDGKRKSSCPSSSKGEIKENEDLKKKFLKEAEARGLFHLEGHRSLGGCRASIYTGMSMKGIETLVDFMKAFAEENSDGE